MKSIALAMTVCIALVFIHIGPRYSYPRHVPNYYHTGPQYNYYYYGPRVRVAPYRPYYVPPRARGLHIGW